MTGIDRAGERDAVNRNLDPATITVEDCSLSFGDLEVLDTVSLSIEPGEFVGFVGPNGAGKTTLLRAISGALEPDSGTVAIGGDDIHELSSRAASRLVSVVPQDTTLSFSFPIRDVVEMGRHPHRSRFSSPTSEDCAAVERALERTRTTELADRPIDEVSGGQRQRVVLARAIAQETPVMLLDEPTGSLDVNHQIETLELVRELVDEGRTVCAAIHDLDLAARYCDRLVMLADGDVYRDGPPSDVLTGDALGDVFDATATVTTHPLTGSETVTAFPRSGDGAWSGADRSTVRIHVLGTGAIAARVLAQLENARDEDSEANPPALEVSLGPVTDGDTAAETARSLAVDCIEIPPFESLSPAHLTTFETVVREADVTVVTESVLDTSGGGTRRLLEVADAIADSIVIATKGESEEDESPESDAGASRERVSAVESKSALEVPAERILEGVADALETGGDASRSIPDAESSNTGSTSSDGDSSSGVSAESSSD
ncbi:heme ABC transporter ATP-binding protein [Natrinema sp. CBA1119]|uniref:heme ABC transporter ATP-binding protein n=1 Tax=Natrinema sp. CBA1119 TaxID=1608465 RepID=UPI000BF92024|nr:heme ABC transporter ATP-binding protein [Natrinema sp. CBA1119]PGF18051.1 heme ABC transporter ATP-binding protein [Natrinema sp. CBA1119]